jgi:hypothetical protein
MKKTLLVAILIYVCLLAASVADAGWFSRGKPVPVVAGPVMTADSPAGLFYDALRPYGEWVFVPAYGWCWYPSNMAIHWRPYTDGHWVYTDAGWTWASDQPWGWACFHYGRWNYDQTYGWIWVPDTVWAPAWVVWRTGGDYVGWAPAPSGLVWREGVGFDMTGVNIDVLLPRYRYSFVAIDSFTSEHIDTCIIQHGRDIVAITATRPSVNMVIENRVIVNRLPIQDVIEHRIGHPIERFRLVDSDMGVGHAVVKNREVEVFRPDAKKLAARHNDIVQHIAAPANPELEKRHQAELKAFDDDRSAKLRQLEETHQQELKAPPARVAVDQLQKQHEQEKVAFNEESQRQRQLLQNWHQQESRSGAKSQRFNLPQAQAQTHPEQNGANKQAPAQAHNEQKEQAAQPQAVRVSNVPERNDKNENRGQDRGGNH